MMIFLARIDHHPTLGAVRIDELPEGRALLQTFKSQGWEPSGESYRFASVEEAKRFADAAYGVSEADWRATPAVDDPFSDAIERGSIMLQLGGGKVLALAFDEPMSAAEQGQYQMRLFELEEALVEELYRLVAEEHFLQAVMRCAQAAGVSFYEAVQIIRVIKSDPGGEAH